MEIVGVIAEFNPFHKGHKRLVDEIKKAYPACTIAVVMSGCFTMRGEPAICDKYLRAETAVKNGADIVVELPPCYATAPAQYFAEGGIKTLMKFPDFNRLAFGSEDGDIQKIIKGAELLKSLDDDRTFKEYLKKALKSGKPFMEIKTKAYDKKADFCDLKKPNNLLAVNYINEAKKLKPDLEFFTVKREDNFNDDSLSFSNPSAKALRKALCEGKDIERFIPLSTQKFISGIQNEIFDAMVLSSLKNKTLTELSNLAGISEGLENRIKKYATENASYSEFLEKVKTKRYTLNRLKRIALSSLLDIDKTMFSECVATEPVLNVLAVAVDNKDILGRIENNSFTVKNCDRMRFGDNLHLKLIEKEENLYEALSGKKIEKTARFVKRI